MVRNFVALRGLANRTASVRPRRRNSGRTVANGFRYRFQTLTRRGSGRSPTLPAWRRCAASAVRPARPAGRYRHPTAPRRSVPRPQRQRRDRVHPPGLSAGRGYPPRPIPIPVRHNRGQRRRRHGWLYLPRHQRLCWRRPHGRGQRPGRLGGVITIYERRF